MFRRAKHLNLLFLFVLAVCSAWGVEKQKTEPRDKWASRPVSVSVGSKTYKLGMMRDKDQKYLAATTNDGQIVRYHDTLKEIFLIQHIYRLSFTDKSESLRIKQIDYEIDRIQTTLNMSYLTEAVLFLRDASSRALAEAIVAALSGGSSTGRTISKAAAVSGAKSFVKDPFTYAKGVNYLTMQSSLNALQRARKNIAEDVSIRNFTYERAQIIHTNLVFGLSRSGTSQVLQGQLYLAQGGKGDLISQMQKVCESMADQLIGKVTESFKHKVLIDEAVLGIKITDFLIRNCPAYAKYVRDTKNLERDFQYETSQYYIQVIEPTVKYWSVTNHQETDKPLSSPEEALKTYYQSLVSFDAVTLLRTVSADFYRSEMGGSTDWVNDTKAREVFSGLRKVVFVKKGFYDDEEAIAVKDYYPTQFWTKPTRFWTNVRSSRDCLENSRGELIAGPDHSTSFDEFSEANNITWVVLAHIYTFKKGDGTWELDGEYGGCLLPRSYSSGERLFFRRMDNEVLLNYVFYPKGKKDSLPSFSTGQRNQLTTSFGEIITNSLGMKFKLIKPGEFMMGSRDSAAEVARKAKREDMKEWYTDEHPQHLANLTKSFYMALTEVTQAQWLQIMKSRPWSGQKYVQEGDNYPAVNVNWRDAMEFCMRLSQREGRTYRLPTEAEWEYACRAGTKTRFCFGNDETMLREYAWFRENADRAGEKYPHQVAQKKPNPWGLYDTHGNAWEWCNDLFGDYPIGPVTDPKGPSSGEQRVLRGGAFYNYPHQCRSAYRLGYWPNYQDAYYEFYSFRVVLDLE